MSDFNRSSRDARLDGTTLTAICKRLDGTDFYATLDLNSCIANINGQLVPRSGGNFAASCSNNQLNGTILSCMAKYFKGPDRPTQINLSDFIENVDGNLVASK